MVDRAMTLNTPTMLQQRRLSNACASTSYHVLRHAVSTPATCRRHWRAISQKRRRPPRVCATTNDQHPTTEPDAQPMVRHLPSSYEDALRESRQFVEAGGMDPVAPPLPGGHVRNDQPVKDDKGMLFDDDEYEHDEEYEGDEEYEQGNVVTAAVEVRGACCCTQRLLTLHHHAQSTPSCTLYTVTHTYLQSTISRQELADLQASLRAQILTHLTDALYSTPGTLVNNASNPVLDTGERNAKEDSSVMPPTADEAAARTAPVIDDAWARGQQPVWVVATEDASQLCQLLVPQGNDLRPAWIAFQVLHGLIMVVYKHTKSKRDNVICLAVSHTILCSPCTLVITHVDHHSHSLTRMKRQHCGHSSGSPHPHWPRVRQWWSCHHPWWQQRQVPTLPLHTLHT